jgi:polyhydroxyalkanoate synthesis regulator phasin
MSGGSGFLTVFSYCWFEEMQRTLLMSDHRREILEMLAGGKITADEAERLIAALAEESPAPSSSGRAPKAKAKYIRITVDAESDAGKAPTKINIRVPIQLLRAGVRLAGLIPAQARQHVEEAMRDYGVAADLSEIKPDNLEEIVDQLQDLTIDVDDDHAKVRIFAE